MAEQEFKGIFKVLYIYCVSFLIRHVSTCCLSAPVLSHGIIICLQLVDVTIANTQTVQFIMTSK